MNPLTDQTLFVGAWRVEPSLNRLSRGDAEARVTPKVMQVLLCLAGQPGTVVSREQLLDTVWAGTVVNDDVVTRAISDLRRAFEDDVQTPRVVETISKSGYRLIAPVTYPFTGDATPAYAGDSASPPRVHLDDLPTLAVPAPHARARRPLLAAGLAFTAAAGLGLAAWLLAPRAAPEAPAPPRPVTSLPGREFRPALSPDGRQVVFAWREAAGANADLYVQPVAGGTPLRLTDDPAFDVAAAWSPDAQRLAFMRHTETTCDLFTVSALGGPARPLASCGDNVAFDLAWSSDGRWLAFSDRPAPGASFSIFLLEPETGARRRLTAPPGQHWGDRDPVFSPDGDEVAFTRSVSMNTQDVFVVPTAGGTPRRLTQDAVAVDGVAWAADGRTLVVAAARDGSMGLWKVDAAGGTPEWIAAAGQGTHHPALARTGGPLVFERRQARSVILRRQNDAASGAEWLPSTRADLHPQLSPDGRRVAFASDRSGTYEIWVSNLDAARPLRLTSFGGPFAGSPRWSPDGRRLAFDARPDGHADVYVVDAAGGRPLRLTAGPSNEVAPSWSPDGRWLYFGSNRSGVWQIWKMPAEGGDALPVTRDGGYAAQASPDGRTLFFTKYDGPGLWQMPAAGGPETFVPGTEDVRTTSDWIVAPDGLLFARPSDDGPVLHRLDAAAGRQEDVAALPGFSFGSGLTRTVDGATTLFVRHDAGEIDLLSLPRF